MVLPSPNGATISAELAGSGIRLLAASLRNAAATAHWLNESRAQKIVLVAAGERWPDGSLRPAIEDYLGAAAVLERIRGHSLSPDAELARAAYRSVSGSLKTLISASPSGLELIESGFAADVELACALDADGSAALFDLEEGCFRPV